MALLGDPPPAKDAALSTLVALIADATKVVEAYYQASSKPYVPSLDSTEMHPLDDEVSPPHLRKAVQTIEAACAQLCAAVAKPKLAIVNRESEIYAPPCLNAAIRLKIADVLYGKPGGLGISEIASAVNVDENKLGRILRLLATKHVFREVTPNVFANNRLSVQLLSSNPLWNLGIIMTDELGKATGELTNILQDPEWGPSTDCTKTALNRATGFKGNLFQYLAGGSSELNGCASPCESTGFRVDTKIFGTGMSGYSNAIEAESVVNDYPWHELPDGSTVCDIGGGLGHMSIALARAHPNLEFTVQDLPQQIQQARICFRERQEDYLKRVKFQEMNFFTDSPVEGCDVYYLKHILHNWSDKQTVCILQNIVRVLKPTSRILIHEFVTQHACHDPSPDTAQAQAPDPLLPNYGVGRIQQYTLDMAMMSLLNSTERTREEFAGIGAKAGLELVKVWDLGQLSLVEFKLGEVVSNGSGLVHPWA
ncbi:S-adenosyl-L-methionine-dependent methyltransferase [Coprinopsis sp. MPI-PUGE-AT-0042]|nr:S-adenosyl-L-methionine-dependent methyltransferase [Coprinopsis sp. MPI-PUGE-AT-0042]